MAAHADHEDGGLLLNDMWQRQQQKAFTAWVNSHLRKVAAKIENIQTDLSDGRLLLRLLEIIGNEELPKPAKGNMRIHKVQNVGEGFKFIKGKGVHLVSIGPEEIVDGNLKMILGMIWTLILRFEIQDISEDALSAKDALLLWCQRKTEGYKGVRVQDFHMSWKDGMAFCALIHRHHPELIDLNRLKKDTPKENLNYAFEVADKHLDIPPMLDAEDIVGCAKPDERSIMTYIAAFYKRFASSNKAGVAAKKISAVLETNRQNEQLIQQYEEMVSNLLAWIQAQIARLNERPDLNTVPDCQAKLEELNQFRANEFPPKLADKGELETHYSKLQTKLRLSGRPAYVPSEGKLVSDVNVAWTGLESAEAVHKEWILAELRRNQLAELKAQKLNAKATAHEAWTAGKDTLLQTDDYSTANLGGVIALKKKHEGFQSDLAAHEAWVSEIGTLAEELNSLKYYNINTINERYAAIYSNWEYLVKLTQDRQAALEEAERKQTRVDQLCVDFALQAPIFSNWLDSAVSQVTDTYLAETEQDVQSLQQAHATFKEGLPARQTEFETLTANNSEMIQLGTAENPYTTHSFESLSQRFSELHGLVSQRDTTLAAEAEKQAHRESLRRQWASSAKETQTWIQSKLDHVRKELEQAAYEKLEDEIVSLEAQDKEVSSYKPTFDALEGLHQQVQEALIFENPHTTISIENLRGSWQSLGTFVRRSITELQNQLLIRDSKHVPEDKMREYRDSFNHFDKDGTKRLDKKEFRACLIAVGYDIPQVAEPGKDQEFERILARVDPNNDGHVSFDEYVAFMAELHADAETSSQLLDAFKVLAGDKDYVTADALRKDLSPDLAEYCIQNMSPFQGGPPGALDYKSFASALYGETDL